MRHPYRTFAATVAGEPPSRGSRWCDLDAEIVIFVVCLLGVVLGWHCRQFGATEIVAAAGAVVSVRTMLRALSRR